MAVCSSAEARTEAALGGGGQVGEERGEFRREVHATASCEPYDYPLGPEVDLRTPLRGAQSELPPLEEGDSLVTHSSSGTLASLGEENATPVVRQGGERLMHSGWLLKQGFLGAFQERFFELVVLEDEGKVCYCPLRYPIAQRGRESPFPAVSHLCPLATNELRSCAQDQGRHAYLIWYGQQPDEVKGYINLEGAVRSMQYASSLAEMPPVAASTVPAIGAPPTRVRARAGDRIRRR